MNEYVVAAFNADLVMGLTINAMSDGVSIDARLAGILADQAASDMVCVNGKSLDEATDCLADSLRRLVAEAEGAAKCNLKRLTPLLETVA